MPVFTLIEDAVSENNQELTTVAATLYDNFYVADDGSLLVRAAFTFSGNNGTDEIPQGATITLARITVNRSASPDYSAGFQGDWRGYLVTTVSAYSSGHNHNLSAHEGANVTTTVVADDNWANAASHTSPDLSAIIQEIVDQGGWPDGGEIGLFYNTTDGPTGWWAFADNSATIEIEWTTGGGATEISSTTSGDQTATASVTVSRNLSATALGQQTASGLAETGTTHNLTATAQGTAGANATVIAARSVTSGQAAGYALRFYGTGYSGGTYDDEDRIVIPIDAPETKPAWSTATGYSVDDYVANDDATYICTGNHTSGASTEPGVGAGWETVWALVPIEADIGAGDFTIEFWARGNTTDNDSTEAVQWINGNIIFDRDRFNAGRKFGISFTDGQAMFGVGGDLNQTIIGSSNGLDDDWHHFCFMRRLSDGRTWILIDGVQDATGIQGTGDQSYPDGVRSSFDDPNDRDHFIVLGAEKHDAGASYPSFNGYMTVLRVSNSLRYDPAGYSPPTAAFTPDSDGGLWLFEEGSGTTLADSATGAGLRSDGTLNIGGPSNGPVWVVSDAPIHRRQPDGLQLTNVQLVVVYSLSSTAHGQQKTAASAALGRNVSSIAPGRQSEASAVNVSRALSTSAGGRQAETMTVTVARLMQSEASGATETAVSVSVARQVSSAGIGEQIAAGQGGLTTQNDISSVALGRQVSVVAIQVSRAIGVTSVGVQGSVTAVQVSRQISAASAGVQTTAAVVNLMTANDVSSATQGQGQSEGAVTVERQISALALGSGTVAGAVVVSRQVSGQGNGRQITVALVSLTTESSVSSEAAGQADAAGLVTVVRAIAATAQGVQQAISQVAQTSQGEISTAAGRQTAAASVTVTRSLTGVERDGQAAIGGVTVQRQISGLSTGQLFTRVVVSLAGLAVFPIPERTYVIAAESRRLVVAAESRTFEVSE